MAGPMSPSPSNPWHLAQTASHSCRPRSVSEIRACSWSQALKAASSTTFTRVYMTACWIPQNSAHWPSHVPVRFGLKRRTLVRPAIASSLPVSAGTHQLWLTSWVMSSSATVRPTGTRSSSNEIAPFGYTYCQ